MRKEPWNIKGIVKKEDFEIIWYPKANETVIAFKGVPLWVTISDSLDEYEFYIYDGTILENDCDFFTLACRDNYGDLFHYGRWENIFEVKKWLDNPVLQY